MGAFVMTYFRFGFFLIITIAAVILWPQHLSAQTVPLWEGVEKNAAMKAADKALIKSAEKLGGRKRAALRASKLGWDRITQGDPETAIKRFNQAWLLNPDEPTLYWGLAVATHQRGDPLSISERWFQETEKRLKNVAPLYSDHGRILVQSGKPKRAITYLEKALAIDPDHVDAHIGMVLALYSLGEIKKMLHYRDRLQKLQNKQ